MSRTGSKGGAAGGGELTKKGKGIDFLATGFKVTTNCAFSVKIMENFKINSDHLLSGEFQAPPFLLASSLLPAPPHVCAATATCRGGSSRRDCGL